MDAWVLLIGDDSEEARSLGRALRARGGRVKMARDAPSALEEARVTDFDFIVCDAALLGAHDEWLPSLKEVRPKADLILLADGGTMAAALAQLEAGAVYDVFPKPLDNFTRLFLAMQRALDWRLAQRQMRGMRPSDTDAVTGLLQRHALEMQLDYELRRARRYGHPLACIVLDLDGFRAVTSPHEQSVSDEVLKDIAHLLRGGTRDVDFVSRGDGDEFTLLLPQTRKEQAQETAERLRATLAAHRFRLKNAPTLQSITASFGVAAFPEDGHDAIHLLRAAAAAVKRAKQDGRNCVR